MKDMNRPNQAELAAMVEHLLALKRDAVINSAKRYYRYLRMEGETSRVKEMWRTVYYNVCDLVQEEARYG